MSVMAAYSRATHREHPKFLLATIAGAVFRTGTAASKDTLSMLLSQKRLLQLLGVLWLIDGLLQLQPRMFTTDMINGVMIPAAHGQPALVAASLAWIIHMATLHLTLLNGGIAGVQIVMGMILIIGSMRWATSDLIKGTLIFSIAWSFVIWYAGEGMNMLLTGQASMLTGAPGSVLFYALLALVVYPRPTTSFREEMAANPDGLLSRRQLRGFFAAFWFFAALLQLQLYWWQPGQISQAIGAVAGQGGLNSLFVDPFVNWLAHITGSAETSLNIGLIILFVGLGVGLLLIKDKRVIPLLVLSIAISFITWWSAQGFGMIFTGMSTDFNSGLLLIVIVLACWPRTPSALAAAALSPAQRSKKLRVPLQKTPMPSPVRNISKSVNTKTNGKQAASSFKAVSREATGTVTEGKPARVQAASSTSRSGRKTAQANMTNPVSHSGKKPNHKRAVSSMTRSRGKRARVKIR